MATTLFIKAKNQPAIKTICVKLYENFLVSYIFIK